MRVPAVIRFYGHEYAGWIEPITPRHKVQKMNGEEYEVDGMIDLDGEFVCPPQRVRGEVVEAQAGGFIFPLIVSHFDPERNTIRVKSNGAPREVSR